MASRTNSSTRPGPSWSGSASRFTALLESPGAAAPGTLHEALLDLLADRETASPDSLPPGDLSPEWARKLSAPFVLDPEYGTRCSTVLTIGLDGDCALVERRFDAEGRVSGQSEHRLNGRR